MVLLKGSGDEDYEITFYTCQVEDQKEEDILDRIFSEKESQEKAPALVGAKVAVYPGVNWFLGSPVAEGESSEEGKFSVTLPAGIYTVVAEKEGVLPSQKVFFVREGVQEQILYAMADRGDGINDEKWTVLLSWDVSETQLLDLDSSLFTPDKAAKGDRNCINTLNRSDGAGVQFLYDGEGSNTCEIIALSSPKRGSYKYYVSNYTDIQAGNGGSSSLAGSGARVTVFHNGIPVRTFSVPDAAGTVWEVFELRNQGIVPIQEVYENVEGKAWWTEDKALARLSERSFMADWIQSDGEWLYFTNPADGGRLYYCRKDGGSMTRFGEDKVTDSRILLVGDQVYYIARNSIVRIKNDGTGRTVVQDQIQLAETDESSLFLVGYEGGMLYYFNAPETFGSVCVLPVDEENGHLSAWTSAGSGVNGRFSYYTFGQFPMKAVVVGHYLYYLDCDYNDSLKQSFCRKNLKTGEEECLKAGVNWHPRFWRIYKGWIYYMEDGAVKRTRLIGPGSLEEVQALADNETDCGLESVWAYYEDACYYPGYDGRIYAMGLDGSGQAALPLSGKYVTVLDGEIYVIEDFGGAPVISSGRNGEGQRSLGVGVGTENTIHEVTAEQDSVIASVLAQELFNGCYHGGRNTLTSEDFTREYVLEAAWNYLYYDYYNEKLAAPVNPSSSWAPYADAPVYYDKDKVNEAMENIYGLSSVLVSDEKYYHSYDTERYRPFLEVSGNRVTSQINWGNSGDPWAWVSNLRYSFQDGYLYVEGEFYIDSNGGIIAEDVPCAARFKINPNNRFPFQLVYVYINAE